MNNSSFWMMRFKQRRKQIINNIIENWQTYQGNYQTNVNHQTNMNYLLLFSNCP